MSYYMTLNVPYRDLWSFNNISSNSSPVHIQQSPKIHCSIAYYIGMESISVFVRKVKIVKTVFVRKVKIVRTDISCMGHFGPMR